MSFDVCSCRNGFLQLDESMVTMNQDIGQGGIILASDGDYLTQKESTIPQFAALNIVDGQVSHQLLLPKANECSNLFSSYQNLTECFYIAWTTAGSIQTHAMYDTGPFSSPFAPHLFQV